MGGCHTCDYWRLIPADRRPVRPRLRMNASFVRLRWKIKKTHSEKIMGLAQFVLAQSNMGKQDLDAIAVTTGPGSFTGLRIGLSIVKAMAQALDIPCIGINTLDALLLRGAGVKVSLRRHGRTPQRGVLRCLLKRSACRESRRAHACGADGRSTTLWGACVHRRRRTCVSGRNCALRYKRRFLCRNRMSFRRLLALPCWRPQTDKAMWKDAYTLEASYYRQSQAEREALMRAT